MPLPFVAFPSNAERARDWPAVPGCTVAGPGGVPLEGLASWDGLLAALPDGPRPAYAVLDLAYPCLPPWLFDAPVPLVALAPDWALQRQLMALALPRCSLAFSDAAGARALRASGIGHAREARLFGLSAAFAAPPDGPGPERDIDVLFCGSLNPAVQGDRLPWLARLARLSSRWRVRIATGVFGDGYRALLRRSRVAFNRSHHGEENQRLAEAASCGALPMLEAGNEEAEGVWLDGVHCAHYGGEDLERVLERWLGDEPARAAAAERGAALAKERALAGGLARVAGAVEAEWDAVRERHRALPPLGRDGLLLLRCWQALGAQAPGDASLQADLEAALDDPRGPAWAALGLAALAGKADPARTARKLRLGLARAPRSILLALGLCEALARLGEGRLAAEGAQRLLASLAEDGVPEEEALWPLPDPSFGPFRMGWQRACARGRERVARWRLHSLLARETGGLAHFHEAALAWPEAPGTLAGLGCALGRAGRPAEAAAHLRRAAEADPFDAPAARALYQSLLDAGATGAASRHAQERRLLAQAAPGLVPEEAWLAPPLPPALPPAPPAAPPADVSWEGPLSVVSSLAHANRRLALGLAERGLRVAARDVPSPGTPIPAGAEREALEALPQGSASVTVRHAWPPDPAPPASGHWVLMQHWEYGSLPQAWLPMLSQADEAWVASSSVRQAFLDAGMPAERVRVVPLGADPALFRPGREGTALPTSKPVKLLFVGGTIHRKGFDVLLRAYGKAFTRDSGVCLVVKDMGVGTFYKGQDAGDAVRAFQAVPGSPEVLLLDRDMPGEELASLYAACDALVLPYRGEGFGLPLAEAMAAGLPVACTGLGAALDFVDEEVGWLVPARRAEFPESRVGDMPTVGVPWLAEPDEDALAAILAEAASSPEERRKRGAAGRRRVEERLAWGHALDAVQAALAEVVARPVRRLAAPVPAAADAPARPEPVAREGTPLLPGVSLCVIARDEESNIGDCLRSCEGLFQDVVVVDTGSTDRTREIALSLGARVIDFPWIDDFAAARNESLKHATRRWVFWMDADDRLDGANREKLRALLSSLPEDGRTAFGMKCRCLPDPETGSATVVDHVRLFPLLPGVSWRYRVHEQILPSLRACGAGVRFADVVIDHTGYVDPALRGRKLARDLRLLEAQRREMGDEPFTLFNLGATYLETGRHEEALPLLEGSLARSHRSDSIVRKLHSLVAHCHLRAGRKAEALRAVLRGLRDCPGDAELGLMEGALRLEDKDWQGAKAALAGLVAGEAEGGHFASVADGLRTFRARHHLAEACLGLGEEADAESLWRRACAEAPSWRPPRSALAGLMLRQRRWDELEAQAALLEGIAGAAGEAAWLRGKALLDRGDAPGAAALLGEASSRLPGDGSVGLLHALALERAGRADEAERRLEAGLAAQPGHAGLLRERERMRAWRESKDRALLPHGRAA